MTEPYLILHKVRGEPAFDIASKTPCPECGGKEEKYKAPSYGDDSTSLEACTECDAGFWWIIPTSGHRAYPIDTTPLAHLIESESEAKVLGSVLTCTRPVMPESWPDHYSVNPSPKEDLVSALGIGQAKPSGPPIRRI